MKNRISFYVKYQEGFTEDLYKKLWNWSVKNSLGLPRGWCDTYERLKEGHCFIFDNWGVYSANFDKDKIKEQLSYGVDNNSQRIEKELSIKEVIELIGAPSQLLGEAEKWEPKVGDYIVITRINDTKYNVGDVVKVLSIHNRGNHFHTDTVGAHIVCKPNCRLARPEEIPREEVEYVECIERDEVAYMCWKKEFEIGKIYKIDGLTESRAGYKIRAGKNMLQWNVDRDCFKPTTREAYEAQQRGEEFKLHIEAVDSLHQFDGIFKQLKEVNKCSTINKNKNEYKNESGIILPRKSYDFPRGKRKEGSKIQPAGRVFPSKSRP